ncbi:MAG: EAL domain-containing protein [Candidatus Sedimenticola sp. 6PFRAG7]
MTLSRQLVLLVFVLLMLVFVGTFFISVQNTRSYLQNQLESHAQDAATSLGLSISAHLADGDEATVTVMTDAIFDRGFYRMVRVEDIEGKPLVDRIQPVNVDGVPDWFIDRLPLETPAGEAAVMSGWVQAGTVIVRSHPGYAYTQLWSTVEEVFWWFVSSAAVVLLIGIALLHLVLKPLRDVAWQADSICNREFPVIEHLPRTLDLRRIVEAMNRMSVKVQRMLDELEKLTSRLRKQAYQHPVTSLPNKTYFVATLNSLMQSEEEFSQGVLCMIQLKDFKAFNDENGYQAGDALLKDAAKALVEVAKGYPKHVMAHLGGADFCMLAQECPQEEASEVGERLSTALAGLYGTGKLAVPDVGHIGISVYDGQQDLKTLLSEADMALRTAQTQGANKWSLHVSDVERKKHVRGALEWREFIEGALQNGRLVLQYQSVVTCDRRLLHHEVLVRITEETDEGAQSQMAAGVFLPQAESLGLVGAIDRAVISMILNKVSGEDDTTGRYAVNISPSSLQEPEFLVWLDRILAKHAQASRRMIFEVPEYGAVSLLEQVQAFVAVLEKHGSQFSIDHFGRSFGSFAYLRSCKANYLKVDGSFMRELDQSQDNQFFVHALAEVAHGLEIQVLGESIETEAVWDLLPGLNLDGGQGYYISRPQ